MRGPFWAHLCPSPGVNPRTGALSLDCSLFLKKQRPESGEWPSRGHPAPQTPSCREPPSLRGGVRWRAHRKPPGSITASGRVRNP